MRIGLNLLHALPEIGGGWNYIESLVGALGAHDRVNEYVAFVTARSECLVPARPNFRPVRINVKGTVRAQRVAYENTGLQLQVRKWKLDCLHWLGSTQAFVNAVPGAVTVYDLLAYRDVGGLPPAKQRYLRFMISAAARRAAILLPISRTTAEDLRTILNVDAGRMAVIPAAVDDRYSPADGRAVSDFRSRFRLPDRFWLYVGHFYPHKNHRRLLQAYAILKTGRHQPWPLVLRGDDHGSEALVRSTIGECHLEKDVTFLPELGGAEMPLLYSAAGALVYPSLFEGGGLPVIEAMACGCPVVGSDIPIIGETTNNEAVYFDPADPDSMARTMSEFQAGGELREAKRRTGLALVREYRPESIAKRLMDAYSRIARSNGS